MGCFYNYGKIVGLEAWLTITNIHDGIVVKFCGVRPPTTVVAGR